MKAPVFNAAWPDEVQALYHHDMREIWDKRIAPHIWNLYHDQLDLYLTHAGQTPLDVLDVGCAQGTLALLLAENGHRVTAVDIRPQFLDYALSRYSNGEVRFIASNILSDAIPGRYDLIFANQIIEHLVHPVQFLVRLGSLLKPGGRVVVSTPNCAYVKNNLPSFQALGNPLEWEHKQFTADGDGHFFAFQAKELQQAFADAGFASLRTLFFETPFISGHMKMRYLHRVAPALVLRIFDRIVRNLPLVKNKFAHQLLVLGSDFRTS
jgi:2-polyprenyl-3-methyl-5-hydroxy-6-metoxy-1,4-benzoquinol methylase